MVAPRSNNNKTYPHVGPRSSPSGRPRSTFGVPPRGWPFRQPDAEWTEFARLVDAATKDELITTSAPLLPCDVLSGVRGRVFGFLHSVTLRKADWLDANIPYLTAAACRALYRRDELHRTLFAYRARPQPPDASFYGVVSILSAPDTTGDFIPPPGECEFRPMPLPPNWNPPLLCNVRSDRPLSPAAPPVKQVIDTPFGALDLSALHVENGYSASAPYFPATVVVPEFGPKTLLPDWSAAMEYRIARSRFHSHADCVGVKRAVEMLREYERRVGI